MDKLILISLRRWGGRKFRPQTLENEKVYELMVSRALARRLCFFSGLVPRLSEPRRYRR